jgi:hypothetical protein
MGGAMKAVSVQCMCHEELLIDLPAVWHFSWALSLRATCAQVSFSLVLSIVAVVLVCPLARSSAQSARSRAVRLPLVSST